MPIIKKGKHKPFFSLPGINFFKKRMIHTVHFTESCRYELGGKDQLDVNKLFGLSQGFHHKNSARFGWRYNPESDMIELFAYCYVKGERIFDKVDETPIDTGPVLEIKITSAEYQFFVNTARVYTIKRAKKLNIGYTLGLYFGGNNPAPDNIEIGIY